MEKFILASGSPRRIEILTKLGQSFRVEKSNASEDIKKNLPYECIAINIALKKAKSVYKKGGLAVLGADTMVVLNGKIYGKPNSIQEAKEMLKELNGKTHNVITGIALITKEGEFSAYSKTKVKFKNLTEAEIINYVQNHQVLDKAGSYAVQDNVVVESYEGSYSNIVGLPEDEVEKMLKEHNLWQIKN